MADKSDYFNTLSMDFQKRYLEKKKESNGCDPYLLKFGDCSDAVKDFPKVSMHDIINYFIYKKSAYTGEDFKAYKSLDSYNMFISKWIRRIGVKLVKNTENVLIIAEHNRFLCETREKDADVIFMGDSIVQALQHTDVWNELFVPLHCLNFGIHRDRIENVLWRIQNGELDNVKPKVIVLHVGTNNITNSPEEIKDGIFELVDVIREKHPDVYIVLPTLLPRGQHPNAVREKLTKVNDLLKSNLDGRPKVELVVIDNGFIQPDGTISHHDMYDYLILTNAGSKKAFEPVYDLILQLLNEGEPEKDLTPSE